MYKAGNLTIVNSTLYGNGSGGLNRSSGTLKLRNSIIAGSYWRGLPRQSGREYAAITSRMAVARRTLSSSDGAIKLGELTGDPGYHPLLDGSAAIDTGSTHRIVRKRIKRERRVRKAMAVTLARRKRRKSFRFPCSKRWSDEEATASPTATAD